MAAERESLTEWFPLERYLSSSTVTIRLLNLKLQMEIYSQQLNRLQRMKKAMESLMKRSQTLSDDRINQYAGQILQKKIAMTKENIEMTGN